MMRRTQHGFTLIELMIVIVIVGILVAIALPNFGALRDRARVAQVKENMHVVQVAVEEFATRNDGAYPLNAADPSAEGGLTLPALLPGGAVPVNPFTGVPTNLDWSNALATPPATDPRGGIALNVAATTPGGAPDSYDILGLDDRSQVMSLVLANR